MIAHGAKNNSIPISLAALVAGFLLIISGYVPFAILGAGLILFSFLLPFLRLGIKPNPPVVPPVASDRSRDNGCGTAGGSSGYGDDCAAQR